MEKTMLDYNRWPNFTKTELQCTFSGADNPNDVAFTRLMDMVQLLRNWYGKPMDVTSGYRSPRHPIEARKIAKGGKAGMHSFAGVDFNIPTEDVHKVLAKCFEMGFTGIGVNMKGKSGRFIHVDLRHPDTAAVWSY
jgi:uncharacterized protein YcbK (DUF882 family)